MAAKNERPDESQREREAEQHKRDALNAVIGEQLLHTLGKPAAFLRVQVRGVWGNHYRANVFVGANIDSARIAHSYFLTADADGNITKSSPSITKTYTGAT